MSQRYFQTYEREPLTNMSLGEVISEQVRHYVQLIKVNSHSNEGSVDLGKAMDYWRQSLIMLNKQLGTFVSGVNPMNSIEFIDSITKIWPEILLGEARITRGLHSVLDELTSDKKSRENFWLDEINRNMEILKAEVASIPGLDADTFMRAIDFNQDSIDGRLDVWQEHIDHAIEEIIGVLDKKIAELDLTGAEDGHPSKLEILRGTMTVAKKTMALFFHEAQNGSNEQLVTNENFISYVRRSLENVAEGMREAGFPTNQKNDFVRVHLDSWYNLFVISIKTLEEALAKAEKERPMITSDISLEASRQDMSRIKSAKIIHAMRERVSEVAEICMMMGNEHFLEYNLPIQQSVARPTKRPLLH